MPGVTPIWAIRYPYLSEVVDPAVFKNFADDVDAALDAVAAAEAAAANGRRYVHLSKALGPSTIATNVETDVTWSLQSSGDDPGAWWSTGTNIVLPAKGLYHVSTWTPQFTPMTTVLGQHIRVKVNGVFRLGKHQFRNGGGFGEADEVSGVVPCLVAGHALVVTLKWNGTGGPATFPPMEVVVTQLCTVP